MSVNKAILIGNLGADPELRYTPTGKAVANFSLATSESWKDGDGNKQEETTWHNIVAWGKQAEVMKEYLTKGQQVYIEGRIKNSTYDDKDGVKKYKSEVVVQNFSFIGKKSDNASKSNPGDNGSGWKTEEPPSQPQGDDDLPF